MQETEGETEGGVKNKEQERTGWGEREREKGKDNSPPVAAFSTSHLSQHLTLPLFPPPLPHADAKSHVHISVERARTKGL